MTIARADETYLIKDTYKDYTVSGSIVYPTDDNKRISVSLSKDNKYVSASIDNNGVYISNGTVDTILMLEYLSINLNEINNFKKP